MFARFQTGNFIASKWLFKDFLPIDADEILDPSLINNIFVLHGRVERANRTGLKL